MVNFGKSGRLSGVVAAPIMLCLGCAVLAQVPTVTPMVTFSGGLYHYNYSITNNSSNDLFDVSLHVQAGPGIILNLSAPVGYQSAYDSGLGLVDFLEDSSTFATGTPVSGFTFDSRLQPGRNQIDGFTFDGANIITNSFTGTTVVPEPGTFALLGATVTAGAMAMRRMKSRKAS